jgi:hypothetical protein
MSYNSSKEIVTASNAFLGPFQVDELLADGRPYICGRRFTAADVTFAALGGPMVAPPQYALSFASLLINVKW